MTGTGGEFISVNKSQPEIGGVEVVVERCNKLRIELEHCNGDMAKRKGTEERCRGQDRLDMICRGTSKKRSCPWSRSNAGAF
jgi:hypothetical protein